VIPSGFQWDEAKNRANVRKHGLDFADAVRIFSAPTLDREDARDDYGEPRVNSIGDLDGVVIINVTHTDRAGDVRLISARRANQMERELYAAFRLGLMP
jgi:uncharacterized DUF497 family protein